MSADDRHEIMTIEEVAQYLRVSERTVYEWAQKGEIPGGKIGTAWRFKRPEVERWVDARLGTGRRTAPVSEMPLGEVLPPERVVRLHVTRKRDALTRIADVLATAQEVTDRDELLREIFKREELMSTGIGFGVAVPHVRLSSVKDLVMAMGVCQEPLPDYESLDDEPVRILCMIAARHDQHGRHIRTLAAISRLLRHPTFREEILAAPDAPAVHALMTRAEG